MPTMVEVGARLINMYRIMKKLMIGIIGLSLVVACNSGSTETKTENGEAQVSVAVVQEDVSVKEANKMINEGDVVLIDVRSLDEYSAGHINGALNIDVSSAGFEEKIADLDKSKNYVVYCQSGRRSAKSSEIMIDAGFKTVYNVAGGISEWQHEGFEVVTE